MQYATIPDGPCLALSVAELAPALQLILSVGTFTVGRAQLGGATSGWRWYWNNIGAIAKKPGRLNFRGVITAGGVTQVRETTLTLF